MSKTIILKGMLEMVIDFQVYDLCIILLKEKWWIKIQGRKLSIDTIST